MHFAIKEDTQLCVNENSVHSLSILIGHAEKKQSTSHQKDVNNAQCTMSINEGNREHIFLYHSGIIKLNMVPEGLLRMSFRKKIETTFVPQTNYI